MNKIDIILLVKNILYKKYKNMFLDNTKFFTHQLLLINNYNSIINTKNTEYNDEYDNLMIVFNYYKTTNPFYMLIKYKLYPLAFNSKFIVDDTGTQPIIKFSKTGKNYFIYTIDSIIKHKKPLIIFKTNDDIVKIIYYNDYDTYSTTLLSYDYIKNIDIKYKLYKKCTKYSKKIDCNFNEENISI